jgi:hypothetical protein
MKATFVKSVALVVFACSASALLGQSNPRAGESPAHSKCAALKELVRFWGPEMMPPELREECASTKIYDNTGESDVPGLPGKPTPQYPNQATPTPAAENPTAKPISPAPNYIRITLRNGAAFNARWLASTGRFLKVENVNGKIQFIDLGTIREWHFTMPWQ